MLLKIINNKNYSNNNVISLVNYLNDNIIHNGESIELTDSGIGNDITETLNLIKNDQKHKTKFDHFCLSFSKEDSLKMDKEKLNSILNDFEKNILLNGGSLSREKIAYTAYKHLDKDRIDIHFVIAKQTTDGMQFDPLNFYNRGKFTPQQVRIKNWIEKINIQYDLDLPEAQKWKINMPQKAGGKTYNKYSHMVDKAFKHVCEIFTKEQSKYADRNEFISAMKSKFNGLIDFKEFNSNGKFYDKGIRVILDKEFILSYLEKLHVDTKELEIIKNKLEHGKLSSARYMENGILNTKLNLKSEDDLINYYKNSNNLKTQLIGYYLESKKNNSSNMNKYKNQILAINNEKINDINKKLSNKYKSYKPKNNVIHIGKYLNKHLNNINYRIPNDLYKLMRNNSNNNAETIVTEMFIWKFVNGEWICVLNPAYEEELKKLYAKTGNLKRDINELTKFDMNM